VYLYRFLTVFKNPTNIPAETALPGINTTVRVYKPLRIFRGYAWSSASVEIIFQVRKAELCPNEGKRHG
jgi:hypothetical protein